MPLFSSKSGVLTRPTTSDGESEDYERLLMMAKASAAKDSKTRAELEKLLFPAGEDETGAKPAMSQPTAPVENSRARDTSAVPQDAKVQRTNGADGFKFTPFSRPKVTMNAIEGNGYTYGPHSRPEGSPIDSGITNVPPAPRPSTTSITSKIAAISAAATNAWRAWQTPQRSQTTPPPSGLQFFPPPEIKSAPPPGFEAPPRMVKEFSEMRSGPSAAVKLAPPGLARNSGKPEMKMTPFSELKSAPPPEIKSALPPGFQPPVQQVRDQPLPVLQMNPPPPKMGMVPIQPTRKLARPETSIRLSPQQRDQREQQLGLTMTPPTRPTLAAPQASTGTIVNLGQSVSTGISSPLLQQKQEYLPTMNIPGGSLRTWSFPGLDVERVALSLQTDGNPLNADVELWQGPQNKPQKMKVYLEEGRHNVFNAVIQTPRAANTVAVRNSSPMVFPVTASVVPEVGFGALGHEIRNTIDASIRDVFQGGSMKTYSFPHTISKILVLLRTDGRPLNAKIEMLSGPENQRQTIEIYIEDGRERPFFAIIETPEEGHSLQIENTGDMQLPFTACVQTASE